MRRKLKLIVMATFAAAMTGCVSMNGKMVNALGEHHDCTSSGGGFGLGAVIGVAMAAASNASCESSAEEEGFLLVEDVGESGMIIAQSELEYPIVQTAIPPAYPCVQPGDRLTQIDSNTISNLDDAKKAMFKESGIPVLVALSRAEQSIECEFELN